MHRYPLDSLSGARNNPFPFHPVTTLTMARRHLTSMHDLSPDEVRRIVTEAHASKVLWDQDRPPESRFMQDRNALLLFEKPSLRTASSIQTAIARHGGFSKFEEAGNLLKRSDGKERESLEHVIGALERYYHFIIARVFEHDTIQRIVQASRRASVVNALCNRHHPLQALADVTTIDREFHDIAPANRRVAYIGDGNNVATSLSQACAMTGMNFVHAGPEKYRIPADEWELARRYAADSHVSLEFTTKPEAAVDGALAVYTDTFVSMGDEGEEAELLRAFAGYQVTPELMGKADPRAVFMHCMPAHTGQEVHKDVVDGPQSRILDIAEDRMHTAAAVLRLLEEARRS